MFKTYETQLAGRKLVIETGKMAAQVLRGEKSIKEMEIRYDPAPVKMVNEANAKRLGLSIPEGYQVIEGTEAQ